MFRLSFRHRRHAPPTQTLVAICLLLAGMQGAARAALISDPLGDFLPTYTGARTPAWTCSPTRSRLSATV